MRLYDNISQGIVKVLIDHQNHFQKSYCYPTQKRVLWCLEVFHGIKISIRTLNYRLKLIEDNKVINRIQRHTRGADGMMLFKSTAYYLGINAMNFFKKIKRFACKTLNLCGLQRLARYYKKSKDLLIKIQPEGGQVVDNLSFNSS
ncbi:MAG: hypothetical protein AAB706_04310 [Patescibacteria group bacterium]